MKSRFVHLRVYSDYSLGEGAIKVKDLVKRCVADKMPALALTDKNNLFASLEFSLEASKNGIQPIMGIDVNLCSQHNYIGKILLLAKDEEGFANLLEISSQIYLNRNGLSVPNLKYDSLSNLSCGLIAIACGLESSERFFFKDKKIDYITENISKLKSDFGDRLYLEVYRHSEFTSFDNEYENFIVNYAYDNDIPLVATNYAAFLGPEAQLAHDALMCIANGRYLIEDDRPKIPKDFYLKSGDEMVKLFADLPEAIENTIVIAKRCRVMAESRPPLLPGFNRDNSTSESEELKEQSISGLNQRIIDIQDPLKRKEYFDRLNFELSVISKMQYPGYFLIVSDFVKWSKQQGIPVGPGRGSGVGSVVAWSLQITDLDPLKFGLIFERFLNPDRVSMPDFDIDFCQERREEVIEYVKKKYGEDRVAQIITFGKLQARAVLRDVGRVLHMPYMAIDKICKAVPNNPANPVTLKQAIDLDKDLQRSRDNDPEINKLLSISLKLEGLNRHVSTHAAGIVIADRPIVKIVPLYKDHASSMPAVQYSMKYAEEAGLVKFDFLGLKTLTVIALACKLIKERGESIDINKIPLTDIKTYELLSRGETVGVFQFESAGMKESIKHLKPDKIEDLIALGALYRPGPMDNIPSYINRKHGKESPQYLHPLMQKILEETYGIIVYQEQVMEIARVFAGYTLGEADLLRRAMGKKIKSEMEAQREVFIGGCVKNNIESATAVEIFALIEKFASYGFNKSHGAAYAIISYQTAFLKSNFSVEFLTASINQEINDTDKINNFVQEAKNLKIEILSPDINKSKSLFVIEGNAIRFGLGAIKNVGTAAINKITEERDNNGKFADIFDFIERSGDRSINKRMLEGLAKAGAMDRLEKNRRYIFENTETLIRYASRYTEDKASKQVGLFSSDDSQFAKNRPGLSETEDWDALEKLSAEFDSFGFYLSSHPLEHYSAKLSKLDITESVNVERKSGNKSIRINIAGVITSRKIRSSAKGRYAFIQLSDRSGSIEVSIFNEDILYASDSILQPGNPVFIRADSRIDSGGLRVVVEKVQDMKQVLSHIQAHLIIHIYKKEAIKDIAASVRNDNNSNDCKSFNIVLHLPNHVEVLFHSKKPYYLNNKAENDLRKREYIKIIEI
jgi:DNA polymerase III subunit alpha